MDLHRYKLTIAYEGTSYFGWQETRAGPSIEGALKSALKNLSQHSSPLDAASRTDRGVHAEGQIVSFTLSKQWQEKALLQALNAHLPADIRVLKVEKVDLHFHPTLEAQGKIYHYRLSLNKVEDPHQKNFLWHYFYPLDFSLMEKAAEILVGKKDFSAFSSRKEKNPICHLRNVEFVSSKEALLEIRLIGDRFLYKMARTLAGTLLYIGSRKLLLADLDAIVREKKREQAGVTAPAKGLFLHKVLYAPPHTILT